MISKKLYSLSMAEDDRSEREREIEKLTQQIQELEALCDAGREDILKTQRIIDQGKSYNRRLLRMSLQVFLSISDIQASEEDLEVIGHVFTEDGWEKTSTSREAIHRYEWKNPDDITLAKRLQQYTLGKDLHSFAVASQVPG